MKTIINPPFRSAEMQEKILVDALWDELFEAVSRELETRSSGSFSFEFDINGFICEVSGSIKEDRVDINDLGGYSESDLTFEMDEDYRYAFGEDLHTALNNYNKVYSGYSQSDYADISNDLRTV